MRRDAINAIEVSTEDIRRRAWIGDALRKILASGGGQLLSDIVKAIGQQEVFDWLTARHFDKIWHKSLGINDEKE